jgi:putative oxidoreductase
MSKQGGGRGGLVGLVEKAYGLLISLGDALSHVLLLIFRISWGWQFFDSGKGKLINHEKVTAFFSSLNIPEPGLNAWLVGGLECFGGLLLLIGFASRPVALLLSVNMLVAYLSVEDDRAKLLGVLHDPTPFLSADPFFFLLAALLVFCFGPGLLSVDGVIRKVLTKRTDEARHH